MVEIARNKQQAVIVRIPVDSKAVRTIAAPPEIAVGAAARPPLTGVQIEAAVEIVSETEAFRAAVVLVTPVRSVAAGAVEPVPAAAAHVAPPAWALPVAVDQGVVVAVADPVDDISSHKCN